MTEVNMTDPDFVVVGGGAAGCIMIAEKAASMLAAA